MLGKLNAASLPCIYAIDKHIFTISLHWFPASMGKRICFLINSVAAMPWNIHVNMMYIFNVLGMQETRNQTTN